MYDLMATYDARCIDLIKATVAEKKVPTKVLTTTYLYLKGLTAEQVESYKNILSECKVNSSDGTKTYKIRFSAYKCDAILPKVETEDTAKERKLADPKNKERKLKRLAKKASKRKTELAIAKAARMVHHGGGINTAYALKRNARKKQGLAGRKSKNNYVDDNKGVTTVHYRRGTLESNLQKHIRQRAEKAGKYVIKQEEKKTPTMRANKPSKANMKPVQKKLALAA